MGATSSLRIDAGSSLFLHGMQDANGNFLLDQLGMRRSGIVDEWGTVANGTFTIGGHLYYIGEDIKEIGANARFNITPTGWLVSQKQPYNNDTNVPALHQLSKLRGTLDIDGHTNIRTNANLHLDDGSLILRGGAYFMASGFQGESGSVNLSGGSVLNLFNRGFITNAGSDGLSGASYHLSEGSQIITGTSLRENASRLSLQGAAPTGGFFSIDGIADALAKLSVNTETGIINLNNTSLSPSVF